MISSAQLGVLIPTMWRIDLVHFDSHTLDMCVTDGQLLTAAVHNDNTPIVGGTIRKGGVVNGFGHHHPGGIWSVIVFEQT